VPDEGGHAHDLSLARRVVVLMVLEVDERATVRQGMGRVEEWDYLTAGKALRYGLAVPRSIALLDDEATTSG
jgi:hypothetical protein